MRKTPIVGSEGAQNREVSSDVWLFKEFGDMLIPSGKDENGCPTLSDEIGVLEKESDAVVLLPCHRDNPHG